MIFTVRNLGPLGDAEIELGRLTIVAGPNNTGKTYLTYALYGFLTNWSRMRSSAPNKFLEPLKRTGETTVPVSLLQAKRQEYLGQCASAFATNLHEVFSCSEDAFPDATVSVALPPDAEFICPNGLTLQFGPKLGSMEASHDGDVIRVRLTLAEGAPVPPGSVLAGALGYVMTHFSVGANLPIPFVLCAERLGISLFYKELDVTRNVLVDQLQKLADSNGRKRLDPFELIEQFSSRYAQPIKDNIDFTRSIETVQKRKSPLWGEHRLADRIKDMMEGYYKADKEGIHFVSKARKDRYFNIPLYLSSASARALSDLYFYLRHQAKPGDLVMIDEPESHLNPANQVLLARLFSLCVNAGLRVYLTTHSDFLVKEINNLIMLSREFPGKERFLARRGVAYTAETYLKPGDVRAYICEGGTLERCPIDEHGIEMRTFDDTIDQINRLSEDLDFLIDANGGE